MDKGITRIIEVVSYHPIWPDLYRQEARQIAATLADEIFLIHPIGSTAIPGIKAKPVIDCLIEVREINTIDSYNEAFISLGYDPRSTNGIPGQCYFNNKTDANTLTIGIYSRAVIPISIGI